MAEETVDANDWDIVNRPYPKLAEWHKKKAEKREITMPSECTGYKKPIS